MKPQELLTEHRTPGSPGRRRKGFRGSQAARVLTTAFALVALALPAPAQQADSEQDRQELLFLTHAGLYKHASLDEAERAVTELSRSGDFEVTTHQGYEQDADELDLSFLTAEYLSGFDGLMLMTNGNLPLTDAQKTAIVDFVRDGGGFVGVHCAALTLYDHPEFGEMLGGYFRRTVSQDRIFVLKVEDPDHPATEMLGPSWPLQDEFYVYGKEAWDERRPEENVDELFGHPIPVAFSRDRVHVLVSIDTERSDFSGLDGLSPDGDYPQAWQQTFGQGRSFYTALGHTERIWSDDPVFRAHVLGGIRWALGLED